MTQFVEKHRKIIFLIFIGIAFVMIYLYTCLTPYMSDDIPYLMEVGRAHSLKELIQQQYGEYLSNSGRVIGQFNVRLSLVGDKQIFNVVNSIMFVALSLLMYANIKRKKSYDLFLYLLILGFLWRYSVSFGQTMLWICGACNYLWGSVFILAFLTFYRYKLAHATQIRHQVLLAIGTFFFGILGGWCNENSSGGLFLLILIFGIVFYVQQKRQQKRAVYPFMFTGAAGVLCGILGMISAPGLRNRSQEMGEKYTGLVAIASRFYKCTVTVRELFWELFVIAIVVIVLLVLKQKIKRFYECEMLIFLFAAAATAYALILSPTPSDRAFFGAGVFLMIAVLQGILDVGSEELWLKTVKYSAVSILTLWLCFTYFENFINLERIAREENERMTLIQDAVAAGEGEVIIPQFRPAFANPYSNVHESDLTEDRTYWMNYFYEVYYGLDTIIAIPRDEWNERFGYDDEED